MRHTFQLMTTTTASNLQLSLMRRHKLLLFFYSRFRIGMLYSAKDFGARGAKAQYEQETGCGMQTIKLVPS